VITIGIHSMMEQEQRPLGNWMFLWQFQPFWIVLMKQVTLRLRSFLLMIRQFAMEQRSVLPMNLPTHQLPGPGILVMKIRANCSIHRILMQIRECILYRLQQPMRTVLVMRLRSIILPCRLNLPTSKEWLPARLFVTEIVST